MKLSQLVPSLFAALFITSFSFAGQEVDRLLAEYGEIETATCKIRRTKKNAGGKIKFLSRVYYTNQGQLHAEGLSPFKRRTIADGEKLFQYVEGDPKGFSRPINQLSKQMSISLSSVPGSPMKHLLRLKKLQESPLPPMEETTRVGLLDDQKYAVLLFDAQKRLIGIDLFKSAEMKVKIAAYTYENLSEVLPGIWIPFTHQISITDGEFQMQETIKVDSFTANQPIAASLFIPANFFNKNIDFVGNFEEIFPE